MKAKSNSRTKSKSPSNNVKPDEMKKNPILPPKKGGSKKEPVKEQAKPLPPKPENAQKTKEEFIEFLKKIYVACSRARESLYVIHDIPTRTSNNIISQFFKTLTISVD